MLPDLFYYCNDHVIVKVICCVSLDWHSLYNLRTRKNKQEKLEKLETWKHVRESSFLAIPSVRSSTKVEGCEQST